MTLPGHPASTTAAENVSVEDLLGALKDSEILSTLGISNETLQHARGDSDLLATLRITHEFLDALGDAGVLDTFFRLQRADQAYFLRVVGTSDNVDLRAQRTRTFVSALTMSPLAGTHAPPQLDP